ncbi:MAG: hypothetical protein HY318_04290 [Armatimonadetes bacterium]|nr:hypothetical protein [Armatimonadota bacterium]
MHTDSQTDKILELLVHQGVLRTRNAIRRVGQAWDRWPCIEEVPSLGMSG